MTLNDQTHAVLVSEIYEAAAEPRLWPIFLSHVADLLASNVVGLSVCPPPHRGEAPEGLHEVLEDTGESFSYVTGISPESQRSYFADWVHMDEISAEALALSIRKNQSVVLRQEIKTDSQFELSDFFQGFVRQLDYFHTVGCLGSSRDNSHVYALSVNRPKRRGPFSSTEETWLASLAPHFKNALMIHQKMSALRLRDTAHTAALSSMYKACFVIDPFMRILWMDPAGQEMLARNDILISHDGQLRAVGASDNLKMIEAVARVMGGNSGSAPAEAAQASIQLKSERGFHALNVAILPKPLGFGNTGKKGALIVADERRPSGLATISELVDQWHLTPAECRVALLLLQGLTPREISERLRRSVGTIRNQVKQVLQKTGSRRQSELVTKLVVSRNGVERGTVQSLS